VGKVLGTGQVLWVYSRGLGRCDADAALEHRYVLTIIISKVAPTKARGCVSFA